MGVQDEGVTIGFRAHPVRLRGSPLARKWRRMQRPGLTIPLV
jgi:hypothetical protein